METVETKSLILEGTKCTEVKGLAHGHAAARLSGTDLNLGFPIPKPTHLRLCVSVTWPSPPFSSSPALSTKTLLEWKYQGFFLAFTHSVIHLANICCAFV